MVRTNTTKLEAGPDQVCKDFECGLARNNAEEACTLIGRGEAALKVSIYPWGVEFDVVKTSAGDERRGEYSDAVA